jgi:hypothetical protein
MGQFELSLQPLRNFLIDGELLRPETGTSNNKSHKSKRGLGDNDENGKCPEQACFSSSTRREVGNMLDFELMKSVAEQMMAGGKVTINGSNVFVKHTSYQRLKNLRFEMNGRQYQAIEQNSEKPSRWGQLAREGHRVVQFRDVETGKYVAVAVDGEVREYAR